MTCASQATPARREPSRQAITVRMRRALTPCGFRNELTVLEIASTPVSDDPPLAKARRKMSRVAPAIRPLP